MQNIVTCKVCAKQSTDEEEFDGNVCSDCDNRSIKSILEDRERKRKENPKLRRERLRM